MSENCGNKLKASSKLLVMVCMENGAISIFRRYGTNMLNTGDPLVQINGKTPPIMYYNTPMTGL